MKKVELASTIILIPVMIVLVGIMIAKKDYNDLFLASAILLYLFKDLTRLTKEKGE